jgi:SEC-C motif-containing protein
MRSLGKAFRIPIFLIDKRFCCSQSLSRIPYVTDLHFIYKEHLLNTRTLCLCGSGIEYQQCCGLFHSGEKIPATAEALMRSRYTAYVLRNAVYLQETWDATKRPEKIDFSREKIDWLRLEITDIKKGGIKDSKGVVAFKAFFM